METIDPNDEMRRRIASTHSSVLTDDFKGMPLADFDRFPKARVSTLYVNFILARGKITPNEAAKITTIFASHAGCSSSQTEAVDPALFQLFAELTDGCHRKVHRRSLRAYEVA